MTPVQSDRIRAQRALVEEHVRRENAHDLPGIMDTFGSRAWYDDEPWGEHHEGRTAVQGYYEDLLVSLPDLRIDITHCLAAEGGVALEVRISGTHLGAWRGLPATGRRVDFPLCGLSFDDAGKLAGERIYYDRASVLRQVGLFHDPQSLLGRLETLCAHPLTVARAYARKVLRVAGLAVALSLGAHPAHGQETAPLDGPRRPFQDSLFERLAGTWLMSGTVGTRPATYALRAEWVLNHQFLRLEMRDTSQVPAYQAIVFIGRDNMSERYVAHWLDIFGGRWSETLGYGTRTGQTVEFLFEYPDGPFRTSFGLDSQGWTVLMRQRMAAGEWKIFGQWALRTVSAEVHSPQ